MKPIIEFKDFSFKYEAQKKPTIKHINLTINAGEKILIAGLSGSGKSTIGHCLNGLIPFVYKGEISGSLKINGQETRDLSVSKLSKEVGTVLQDSDGQFVGLSVGEDIAFALENDNIDTDTMHKRVKDVASKVDMSDFLGQMPNELSGGQKQRVSLAGVMVDDVDILLFDEPLANLDPATGKSAIELIDEISMSDTTIIIIEHRLEDVLFKKVDRIILIEDGEIIADEDPDTLLASDLLYSHGIREPLYLRASKFAGVKINKDNRPGYSDSFVLSPADENMIKAWAKENVGEKKKISTSILEIDNVSFSYDGVRETIKDLSFKVNKGEMLAIVGKNGAGKSTISKLLAGFIKEDRGRIVLNGRDLKDDTIFERGQKIGIVLQNPNQMICNNMIFDEVAFGLVNNEIPEDIIKQKVEQVLKVCGLYEFRNWPISALSYGQKKRVTIASILVMEPDIIVLDEPTAGQDYRHYTEIMDFLEELNDRGQTIIIITHDMHLMLEYCDRAIAILNGQKLFDGPCSELLSDEEIVSKANLKLTSLYDLALSLKIDPVVLTNAYISAERRSRNED